MVVAFLSTKWGPGRSCRLMGRGPRNHIHYSALPHRHRSASAFKANNSRNIKCSARATGAELSEGGTWPAKSKGEILTLCCKSLSRTKSTQLRNNFQPKSNMRPFFFQNLHPNAFSRLTEFRFSTQSLFLPNTGPQSPGDRKRAKRALSRISVNRAFRSRRQPAAQTCFSGHLHPEVEPPDITRGRPRTGTARARPQPAAFAAAARRRAPTDSMPWSAALGMMR